MRHSRFRHHGVRVYECHISSVAVIIMNPKGDVCHGDDGDDDDDVCHGDDGDGDGDVCHGDGDDDDDGDGDGGGDDGCVSKEEDSEHSGQDTTGHGLMADNNNTIITIHTTANLTVMGMDANKQDDTRCDSCV